MPNVLFDKERIFSVDQQVSFLICGLRSVHACASIILLMLRTPNVNQAYIGELFSFLLSIKVLQWNQTLDAKFVCLVL